MSAELNGMKVEPVDLGIIYSSLAAEENLNVRQRLDTSIHDIYAALSQLMSREEAMEVISAAMGEANAVYASAHPLQKQAYRRAVADVPADRKDLAMELHYHVTIIADEIKKNPTQALEMIQRQLNRTLDYLELCGNDEEKKTIIGIFRKELFALQQKTAGKSALRIAEEDMENDSDTPVLLKGPWPDTDPT